MSTSLIRPWKRVCSQFSIAGNGRKKTHVNTVTQITNPFLALTGEQLVVSPCSLILFMLIGVGKNSFVLGTKCSFSTLEIDPPSIYLYLHFSLKPLNPEDELRGSISGCCSLILEVVLPLSTRTSTLLSVLHDFKTHLDAFNLAEDEYIFKPLVNVSLMIVQFIIIIKLSFP